MKRRSIVFTSELLEKLEYQAKHDHVSVSAIVRKIIRSFYEGAEAEEQVEPVVRQPDPVIEPVPLALKVAVPSVEVMLDNEMPTDTNADDFINEILQRL